MEAALTQKIKTLPHAPGVYQFIDKDGQIIYVGKAVDLKNRVSQYFQKGAALGEKTALLVSQIYDLETIKTASEFDALLLEAKLIQTLLPKYNSIAKDDKSPLYIVLTFHEELPRLTFVRKTQLQHIHPKDVQFGPFQSARAVRMVVKKIRSFIPYCTQKMRNGRPCFYTHLGLCQPCPSVVAKLPPSAQRAERVREIRKNMFLLRDVLSGKSVKVLETYQRDMTALAEAHEFEKAGNVRDHIRALEAMHMGHYDPELYIQSDASIEDQYVKELTALRVALLEFYPKLTKLTRIECIDISHTTGLSTAASLVVLSYGYVDRSQYRRFKVRAKSPNDIAAITEVVTRRLGNKDWPLPDVLMVDGGKGQVRAAWDALLAHKLTIPILGLAKRFEQVELYDGKTFSSVRLGYDNPALHILQRVRDEAHRFALRYHRLLRKKSFAASYK